MYGIYANIGGILMVNVTIYSIHGSYGMLQRTDFEKSSSPRSLKFAFILKKTTAYAQGAPVAADSLMETPNYFNT